MPKHRRPRDRVSKDVPPHNTENRGGFNPVEALQILHLEVVQLEALANAAGEAVVQLPFPPGREARRVFDRVYALVMKVAEETSSIASHGDELVADLAAHLKGRETGS